MRDHLPKVTQLLALWGLLLFYSFGVLAIGASKSLVKMIDHADALTNYTFSSVAASNFELCFLRPCTLHGTGTHPHLF